MSETDGVRFTTFQDETSSVESQGVCSMLELVPDIWTIAACVKQLNCLNHGGGDSDEEGNPIEDQEEEEEPESLVESQEETDATEYQEDFPVESQNERRLREAERDEHMSAQQRDDQFGNMALIIPGCVYLCGMIMVAIVSFYPHFYSGADIQFRNERVKEGYGLAMLTSLTRNECVILYSLFVVICLIVSLTIRATQKNNREILQLVQEVREKVQQRRSLQRLRSGRMSPA